MESIVTFLFHKTIYNTVMFGGVQDDFFQVIYT